MEQFRPILAATCKNPEALHYPVLATPKLDGIRCLKREGKALTRSLKPIPNYNLRRWIEKNFPDGTDGELIIEDQSFNQISSVVMTRDCVSSMVEYWIFDFLRYPESCQVPYRTRIIDLENLKIVKGMVKLIPVLINNHSKLMEFEAQCVEQGFEGICLRSPDSLYKFGRSTEKQQWLLKIKRFEDSEATIIGFEEKMHNSNDMVRGELGQAKRATTMEGMVPMNTLGALLVRDERHHWTFSVGSGFDDEQRKSIWANRKNFGGLVIKYKFQSYGIKDGPRFPIFLAFRDKRDL